jgi:hypothetical protein
VSEKREQERRGEQREKVGHTVKNWYMAIGNKRQAETPDDKENSRFVPISPKTLNVFMSMVIIKELGECSLVYTLYPSTLYSLYLPIPR